MIGAILTGGASRRFGSDKALVMGASVRDALRGAGADPVIAVGGTAGPALGVITVPDRRPGEGPLAGLASALIWAGPAPVLAVACDLPLLSASHLGGLLAAFEHHDHPVDRALVAMVDGVAEPSLAIWPGSSGRVLWQAVERGERALRHVLDLVPWAGFEVPAAALSDADTPAELAEHLAETDDPSMGPPERA